MKQPTLPMRPDFSSGPVTFLKEVRSELKKVVWPGRNEVIKLTSVVIIVSMVIGIYIGTLDIIITKVIDILLQR